MRHAMTVSSVMACRILAEACACCLVRVPLKVQVFIGLRNSKVISS